MLKGEKVTLRTFQRDDIKTMNELSLTNISEQLLFSGDWFPYSRAGWEKGFDKDLDKDEEPSWFIIEVDGTPIGSCGLHTRKRFHGTTSLGIGILRPEYLGQGYGRDAMKLLLYYAFQIQNFRRVWLSTLADNERAIRSYLACGFILEGREHEVNFFYDKYHDVVLMGLLRKEWQALNFPRPVNIHI